MVKKNGLIGGDAFFAGDGEDSVLISSSEAISSFAEVLGEDSLFIFVADFSFTAESFLVFLDGFSLGVAFFGVFFAAGFFSFFGSGVLFSVFTGVLLIFSFFAGGDLTQIDRKLVFSLSDDQ